MVGTPSEGVMAGARVGPEVSLDSDPNDGSRVAAIALTGDTVGPGAGTLDPDDGAVVGVLASEGRNIGFIVFCT